LRKVACGFVYCLLHGDATAREAFEEHGKELCLLAVLFPQPLLGDMA